MSIVVKIKLNEGLFLKDPQDSALGRNILENAICMIADIGFERFNFKKLAAQIHSTEASVYRYFENKHILLIYLVSWYWEWVSFLIKINTIHVNDPRKKLAIIIKSFVSASVENPAVEYVNESMLHDVVVAEGMKAYHTKEVDKENSKGFFTNYMQLTKLVSDVILEIDSSFQYPLALASNLLEMSHSHIYFVKHLPTLTDTQTKHNSVEGVEKMLNYFVDRLLVKG